MTTECRWVTAFFDVGPERFDAAEAFWTAVTATTLSERRGDDGQFVTLVPEVGDPYLRMQRLAGAARIHLDLHVPSIEAGAAAVESAGGRIIEDRGYMIAASPGRFVFCLVDHLGEHDRGPRLADPVEHRVDVVVLDAPHRVFEVEVEFWATVTDQPATRNEAFPEYAGLPLRHRGLPLNLLVQQLGADDHRTDTTAHLDISAGSEFASVVARHVELGATVAHEVEHWTVLRDPSGLVYCITDRQPD